MSDGVEDVRAHLGELGRLTGDTELAERRILGQAQQRLDLVNEMLERQRPGVEGAPDAAQDRYLDLVQERGQLQMVIAKAKHSLGLR